MVKSELVSVSDDVLRFELEGSASDSGRIRLDALDDFFDQVQRTLFAVEREITGQIRTNSIYVLDEVRLRRRLRVGIRGKAFKPDSSYVGDVVFPRLKSEARSIARGIEPPGIETDTLETFAGFESARRRGLQRIRLFDDEKPVTIDERFDSNVRSLLGNVYRSVGTFRGRLEAVNLHTNPSSAYIYPLIGPSKVRCTFTKGRFPNIGEHLEREIEVSGVLLFREDEPHPFAIEAEAITGMRSNGDLPRAVELVGLMPELTRGLNPVEYLSDIRNEAAA